MRIAIAAQTNRIMLTKAQIEGVQKSGDTGRDLFGAHPPALASPGLALPVRTEFIDQDLLKQPLECAGELVFLVAKLGGVVGVVDPSTRTAVPIWMPSKPLGPSYWKKIGARESSTNSSRSE